jgi:hypothetical protein
LSGARPRRWKSEFLSTNQKVVNKILKHQGLDLYAPVLPKTHIIATNSVRTMVNQIAYTQLAQKVGATMPPRPDLPTGTALINNRFLQTYNGDLLRSIATKLGCELPPPEDIATGSTVEQTNRIIKQNAQILKSIGEKIGSL